MVSVFDYDVDSAKIPVNEILVSVLTFIPVPSSFSVFLQQA